MSKRKEPEHEEQDETTRNASEVSSEKKKPRASHHGHYHNAQISSEKEKLRTSEQGEEHDEEGHHHNAEMLELGHIHFFYRPKVNVEEATSMQDVKRLLILLAPKDSNQNRLLIVPKKHIPNVETHERVWSFVQKVGSIDELVEGLGEEHYHTKTRGERTSPRARLLATGVYTIATHKEHSKHPHAMTHTHLAYVLELPHTVTSLHKAFKLQHEGSFVITVKNPKHPSPNFIGLKDKDKPRLPEDLQRLFEDRKFMPVNPPRLIDYPGSEIIMVGAKADIAKELEQVGEEVEELAEKESRKLSAQTLYKQLHLSRAHLPVTPLKGKWA